MVLTLIFSFLLVSPRARFYMYIFSHAPGLSLPGSVLNLPGPGLSFSALALWASMASLVLSFGRDLLDTVLA